MTQNEIILLVIVLITFFGICFYIDRITSTSFKCFNKEEHDWKFTGNSRGNTGDLGFGIKGYWNVNYYRCSKCGKTKEKEIY